MTERLNFKDNMEWDMYLDSLAVGKMLVVTTEDFVYTIERREDGIYIFDGVQFPIATKVEINSMDGDISTFTPNYLKAGWRMNIVTEDKKSIDSKIVQDIKL